MNIEIANKLQKLRKENGYSQESLADALGISRQAVSKWERAESSPDTDNLICLAKLYNISLDELLSSDESVDEIVENNKKEEVKPSDDDKYEHSHEIFKNGKWEKKASKKFYLVKDICVGVGFVITLTAFLLTGFLMHIWSYNWILFLLYIAFCNIFDCIENKTATWSGYTMVITAVYCYLGLKFDLWHPYWFLFITIPIYYIIMSYVNKIISYHHEGWDPENKEEND